MRSIAKLMQDWQFTGPDGKTTLVELPHTWNAKDGQDGGNGYGYGDGYGNGLSLDDLSLVETHDCFTVAELMEYEAMGLAERGQGARVIAEGISRKDGRLPINPSGGLKSKGHPIGATGVSMHVMAAMQLTGQAGDMQLPTADRAGVFNMGGAAVTNYVSILETVQ